MSVRGGDYKHEKKIQKRRHKGTVRRRSGVKVEREVGAWRTEQNKARMNKTEQVAACWECVGGVRKRDHKTSTAAGEQVLGSVNKEVDYVVHIASRVGRGTWEEHRWESLGKQAGRGRGLWRERKKCRYFVT